MKINLLNDSLFKTWFKSNESRPIVAKFLSSLTNIDVELLINANYIGGDLQKEKHQEKLEKIISGH